MTTKNTSNLITKIAAASVAMGTFATDKENKDQKYGYISADAVLSRAGRALAEQGVVVAPAITAEATEQISYESYGKKKNRFDSVIEMDILVTDGEMDMMQHWVGRGVDYSSPDKAMYKAITSGHKYFLMKLLNIGVGNEDGEHDDAETAPQPPQGKKTPAPAQPVATQLNGDTGRPGVPEKLRKTFHALGSEVYGDEWDTQRPKLVEAVTAGNEESSKKLTATEMQKLIDGMRTKRAQLQAKAAQEAT